MSNVSIAGHVGKPAYDTFLILPLLDRPVYDSNPLRPNPNPQKPCRGCELGHTLTLLAKIHETFNEAAISHMPTTLSSLKAMVQA